MKNFEKIGETRVLPFLEDLESNLDFWGLTPERASYKGSAHHSTDCIILRGNKSKDINRFQSEIESDWWDVSNRMGNTVSFIDNLVNKLSIKSLGKVMYTALYPGSEISEHIDEGLYSDYYSRMHIPVVTSSDVIFYCGDEELIMEQGSIYTFNHKLKHRVCNRGVYERVHLIIDYRR